MSKSPTSFRSRIDRSALRELWREALPSPMDALNLVTFADEACYRWYGLLLLPAALPLAVRPVWIGVHVRSLFGEKCADEIVIVRYPSHRVLLKVVSSRYYSLVNRLREKGVSRFEFSMTWRHSGERRILDGGPFLFVHFNARAGAGTGSFKAVRSTIESGPARLLYASRETSPLSIFRSLEPSDPNPARYRENAMFAIPDSESAAEFLDGQALGALRAATDGLSLQVYRRLRILEAMPWAKGTVPR